MSCVALGASASASQITVVLNACIDACTHSHQGYARASVGVREPSLELLLQHYSDERFDFVLALQAAIHVLGACAENEDAILGVIHRGWKDERLALAERSDALVLEECVRGDTAAILVYESVLSHARAGKLPSDVRVLVQRQFLSICDARSELQRRIRDRCMRAKMICGSRAFPYRRSS
jgi:uncharacterized protein (TIGR02284 family)